MDLAALHRAHVETLSRGTEAALERAGFAAVAIHSGTALKRTEADDQYWPLRPTPHFQHWLPLAEPGCWLVIAPGRKPSLHRSLEYSFWEAPAEPESDHFWGSFEVASGKPSLPPGRVAFVGDDLRAAEELGLLANPPQLVQALDQLRVTKTPYEVECLAEANRRAAVGHEQLRKLFHGGDRAELELHLAFLGATRQDDAETPYKNIVALGKHAATLHHIAYEKRAQPAGSLLVDAGASFAGYGSDITRTWVKGGGALASSYGQLVAGLEAMQQRLCASVRVGMPYEELHDQSHRLAAGVLRDVGISRLPADELVARGITRAFYPHGLGHSLGLQCHDVGCALRPPRKDNPFLRNTTEIAVDQVFTIEPGIYFIDALLDPLRASPDIDWKLVDGLQAFGGVRIEDDVVVRPNGIRNLTREVLPQGGGVA
ncbi:MAG: Xaa-Pro dipeptidase [Deltaproteobacteria bacterium]|nr:MAG: Xaa-Pro dipeptidase [Deltaproteobacteria bacterium]